MKYEWRKQDKQLYLPKEEPTIIDVPTLTYLSLNGTGNPNGSQFKAAIQALYTCSYTLKMAPKKGFAIPHFFDYTVFPLEAFWDSKVPVIPGQPLDKEQFIYTVMIRQPEFVTEEVLSLVSPLIIKKIGSELFSQLTLTQLTEGRCLQLLHVGSYDDEPRSFQRLADYCEQHQLKRQGHQHKEIYLNNAEKTEPAKLKTILRIPLI